MQATIINGKELAKLKLGVLADKIKDLEIRTHKRPALAIVLVGDNSASLIYVKNKLKAAKKIGIDAHLIKFNSDVTSDLLISKLNELNNNKEISGIIVQLPLPKHISKNDIIANINPYKDVDGFHPVNVGYLHSNINKGFVPCTALGCLELIKSVTANLKGKNVAVVGRSNIVGRPLSGLLINEDSTVTICHSHTVDLKKITLQADIVVLAAGKYKFFDDSYFNENAIIIDVGINRIDESENIAGDASDQVKHKVKYITPVPGGVGPMTICFLLENTYKAFMMSMDEKFN